MVTRDLPDLLDLPDLPDLPEAQENYTTLLEMTSMTSNFSKKKKFIISCNKNYNNNEKKSRIRCIRVSCNIKESHVFQLEQTKFIT